MDIKFEYKSNILTISQYRKYGDNKWIKVPKNHNIPVDNAILKFTGIKANSRFFGGNTRAQKVSNYEIYGVIDDNEYLFQSADRHGYLNICYREGTYPSDNCYSDHDYPGYFC